AMTAWVLLQPAQRRRALPFLMGAGLVSAIAAIWLVSRGALLPMVEHLLWTSRNYGAANHVPYGGIPGGYGVLFEDASRGELLLRAVFTFFIALPALLPPVALVWFLPKYRRSEPALLLLVCAAGLLVSCLPRW